MMRATLLIVLLAGLAGCYPATPFSVRTEADRASNEEAKQRLRDLDDSMAAWRRARREEAKQAVNLSPRNY